MSEEMTDKPFGEASDKVEAEHKKSVEDLKAKVAKAKAEALRKINH